MVRLPDLVQASASTPRRFGLGTLRLAATPLHLVERMTARDPDVGTRSQCHAQRTPYTRVDMRGTFNVHCGVHPLPKETDDGKVQEDQRSGRPGSIQGASRRSDRSSLEDCCGECLVTARSEVGQEVTRSRRTVTRTIRVPVRIQTRVTLRTLRCSACGFEDVPIAFVMPSSPTGMRCPRCGRNIHR